jgi:hypothetical protein
LRGKSRDHAIADAVPNLDLMIAAYQTAINSPHSHSIINEPFLSYIFNSLFSC